MKEKNYGDTTWRAYAKLMNDMSTRFTAEISPYRNLFNITSVEDFDEIDAKIRNNSGFADYNDNPGNYGNKCYGGTASAALNMYKKFLRGDEGSKKELLSYEFFRSMGKEHDGIDAVAEKFYQKFRDEGIYFWKTLSELSEEDILTSIFLLGNKNEDNESLCHALEYNRDYDMFGGIGGGTVSKYGLFYGVDGQWKATQEQGKPKPVTLEKAIEIEKEIRDVLVMGAITIQKWQGSLNTVESYCEMFKELDSVIPKYIHKSWFLKYYYMSFPDVLLIYYSEE
ncbi:MAG: hypothetical protein LUD41_00305 [Phascolarctobacterium sp.]|nr:hypothetical protein [Phascolarctobacterium sp.]